MAGGAEAGDRRGVLCSGLVGVMAARHYDVNANQVFSWRKRYRDDPRAPIGG
jgi:transposase-like protein